MQTISNNEQKTIELGKKLASGLKSGDVLCLFGELGSGKTTLVKGIAKGLRFKKDVTSPTFTLMNVYKVNSKQTTINRLVHIDTYRLQNEQELLAIGVEDYIGQPGVITIIEWPEKIENLLKNYRVKKIFLEHLEDNKRKIAID